MTERLRGFDRLPPASPATVAVDDAGAARLLRPAAVAICVVPGDEGEACFVLTRRAAGLRAHTGQWALPGGRIDEGESVVEAALREVEEEGGLRLAASSVIGVLDDYPTRSGFLITPVAMWCDDRDALLANAGEVASIHVVPLAEL